MSDQSLCRTSATLLVLLALSGCAAGGSADLMPQDLPAPWLVQNWASGTEFVAKASIACDIDNEGRPSGCAIRRLEGNAAFAEPALEYARALIYQPSMQGDQPVADPNHVIEVGFRVPWRGERLNRPAAMATAPPVVYPKTVTDSQSGNVRLSCTVQVDGTTADCVVRQLHGDPAFAEAALTAVRKAHYMPAWRSGRAVPENDHAIVLAFAPPPYFPNKPELPAGVLRKLTSSQRLLYPQSALEREIEGSVLVVCDLGTDGVNRNCSVAGLHGDPAFEPAALAYASSLTGKATLDGVPVEVPRSSTVVTFMLDRDRW